MPGGMFSEVAVRYFSEPKFVTGTKGWLVTTDLSRVGNTILVVPHLQWAGEGYFDPYKFKSMEGHIKEYVPEEPTGRTHEELVKARNFFLQIKEERSEMKSLLEGLTFEVIMRIICKKIRGFDYGIIQVSSGSPLSEVFCPNDLDENDEYEVILRKGEDLVVFSTDDPETVAPATSQWLVDVLLGLHGSRQVVIPITPGDLARIYDRLWKYE